MATIYDAVEEAPKNDMDVEPSQKTKNNRKKRKRPARDDTTEPDTNLQIKTKASKKQELQQGTRSSPDLAADNESSKKRKRRKEKKSSPESIPKVKPPLEDTTGEKQKNETGFPDPEEDVDEGGLPDQAKKALSYAFKRFHEPYLWKFSKAKQNWLIRNFWKAAIPERYDGLIIRYLSAVQGKARDNLTKTCREVIDAQPPLNERQAPQQISVALGGPLIDATSTVPPGTDEGKARAQALLQALESHA